MAVHLHVNLHVYLSTSIRLQTLMRRRHFLLLTFPIFLLLGTYERSYCQDTSYFDVRILHPGISESDSVEMLLAQVVLNKEVMYYFMDVKSVVCGDKYCKIDQVRIYWDPFGIYDTIQLEENVDLEKAKGLPFSEQDYNQLNSILADQNSLLRELTKHEITGKLPGDGFDAVSGATYPLPHGTCVKGSAWTTYTLWHWVNNNDVVTKIRDLSGDLFDLADFHTLLESGNKAERNFVFEQLIRLKQFDSKTVSLSLPAMERSIEDLKSGLDYLEYCNPSHYEHGMINLINESNSRGKIYCYNTVLNAEKPLPGTFILELARCATNSDSYQEIDLFFRLLERKNKGTTEIHQLILPLLESTNFLIARRAYYYLSKQELTRKQERSIGAFKRRHSEKLL